MVGDDTTALQCVLNSDIERTQLLEEESHLLALQVKPQFELTSIVSRELYSYHFFSFIMLILFTRINLLIILWSQFIYFFFFVERT